MTAVQKALEEPRRRIEPRLHTPVDGTPFLDPELQVPHSDSHRIMVYETGSILDLIAKEAGLFFQSDQSVWYIHPETDEQRVFFGDWVFGKVTGPERITAEDLVLVMEVVTTSDRRKELKDTRFQLLLNEYNEVPEFGLVFPDLEDPRALTFYRLQDGHYREEIVAPGGIVRPQGVEGLEIRVRPKNRWESGRKLDIFYKGEPRLPLEKERERAVSAEERAVSAEERAAALAARLQELGVDPDAI